VMLADSYFCSYFLIADMLRRGVDVLFEQHGARIIDFRRGERLTKTLLNPNGCVTKRP